MSANRPRKSTSKAGSIEPGEVDNLAAVTLSLSAEEMKTLDDVSALPPEYPGWMLTRQGAGRRPEAVPPDRG